MVLALERRPWLSPLLLALLCIIFFRNVLLPEPGLGALAGHDLPRLFYPWFTFIVRSIHQGEFPLWNPFVLGGYPVVANPQFGLYYPPNWLMLIVGPQRGIALLLVLHVWWGGWGMAKLTRRLDASALGGLLAGVIYCFSWAIVRIWAGHYTLVLVGAWIPWVLLAYFHSLQRGTWRSVLPGMAAMALAFLAGHQNMLLYLAMLLVGLGIYHVVAVHAADKPVLPALWLATRQLALMVAGSALLGAVQLLPTLEFSPLAARAHASAGLNFALGGPLPGAQLLTILVPNLLGHPNLPELGYWGGANYEEASGGFASVWAISAAVLALQIDQRRRIVLFYWLVGLAGLLLSIGASGGLLVVALRWLPLLRLFRAPSRGLYLTTFALAGLSALVISHLQSAKGDERARWLQPALQVLIPDVLVLIFVGVLVLLVLWSVGPPNVQNARLGHMANALGETGLMVIAVSLSLRLWRDDCSRPVTRATLVTFAVVLIDLWRIGLPLVNMGEGEPFDPTWRAVSETIPANDPTFRTLLARDSSWVRLVNAGMVTGHYTTDGDAPAPEHLDINEGVVRLSPDPTANNNRLLGVQYVVIRGTYKGQGFQNPQQARLIAPGALDIYEVEGGLRAFLPTTYEILPDYDALDRLWDPEFDPAHTVILDREPGCTVSGRGGTAVISAYTLNQVTLDVHADGPGLLVLTDQWYPGWKASLMPSEQPLEVLRAYTTFRAVCVPEGHHSVTFQFRPQSWLVGLGLSLAGWAGLLGVGIFSVLQRGDVDHETA